MPEPLIDSQGLMLEAQMVDDTRFRMGFAICNRCGAFVAYPSQHADWHGAVDSNTTTQLPGGGPDA